MLSPSNLSTRKSLIGTSMLTAVALCSPGVSSAADWVGGIDSDWNTAGNWSTASVPSGEAATINLALGNIATISSDIAAIPNEIFVGSGAEIDGQLNHIAGTASTSAGSWFVVGNEGGTGVYNLADTEGSGGPATEFAEGSGSVVIDQAQFLIGLGENGVGTANIHTSGELTVGHQLAVGNGAGLTGANGTLNMDGGTLTTGVDANPSDPNAGGLANVFFGQARGRGTLNFSGGTFNVGAQLFIGSDAGSVGTAVIDGGTINTGTFEGAFGDIRVGNAGATGEMTVNAGTINTGGWNFVGSGAGSQGSLIMNGGQLTNETQTRIGDNGGEGTLTLSGGSYINDQTFTIADQADSVGTVIVNDELSRLEVTDQFWIGQGAGSDGTLELSAGEVAVSDWLAVARVGGTGTLNMSGGTLNKTGGGDIAIGGGTGGVGVFNQTGGILNANNRVLVGEDFEGGGTATYTLSGTGEANLGVVLVGKGGSTGTLNLDGGTMSVSRITGGAGQSDVFFNGARVIANDPEAPFIDSLIGAEIAANGLELDSNGFDVTVPQSLTGQGGVRKLGQGTLRLTSNNAFTGDNVIEAGKLAITSFTFETGGFTVAESATFGAIQDFPDEILEVPFIEFPDSGGATIEMDLGAFFGNPGEAPLNVTETLTLNGPVTVDVLDEEPELGTIPLISYAGPKVGTGEFVLGTLPDGVTATLSDDGSGLVSLEVTAIAPPTTGFQDWAAANGLTPGENDGASQDPDGDGVANLLEFVLGGDPLIADASVLPVAEVTADDFVFRFDRSDDSEAEVDMTFEWSTDLAGWTDVAVGAAGSGPDENGVSVEIDEGDPATEDDVVTVRLPRALAPEGRLFGRLQAGIPVE